ncbi:uncharacterized protein A4U43_C10F5920 [Asparagus officinalis]|uniref:Uncharacterized protein n=1 Tax=Asparagus officinalis TaxID=4686 RepID=A0A5P1E4A9_ASPOF|nr:uncharacterized protein A4U43_C10F5920 [Asparagus officinalis]
MKRNPNSCQIGQHSRHDPPAPGMIRFRRGDARHRPSPSNTSKSRHRLTNQPPRYPSSDVDRPPPSSQSRSHLSPRGSLAPVNVSSRAAVVAGAKDSAFFAGMKRCAEDPYDPADNPDGVIQLGVAETKVGS